MKLKTIFRLWLPLAISFELMMLEGPAVQAAIGRLPETAIHMAAWGLTMSLSLILESPIIMLISTAIALVDSPEAYHALRRFMIHLITGCTLATALVAFTPLYDSIALHWMGQPEPIMREARPALQIMLLWAAAIGWRRFYQGVLVRYKQTRKVSWGTAFRLASTVGTAIALTSTHRIPGVQVAAWTLMAGVITEAIATTLYALPLVRREVLTSPPAAEPLTQKAIWSFHAPLALTTFLTLLAQPLTAAALARLAHKELTLAAWPIIYMVLLVMRGWCMALQEIAIAQGRFEEARPILRRFTLLVGGITSGATLLLVVTPLLQLYMTNVLHIKADLQPYVRYGVAACVPLPLLTAIGSWVRGLLVMKGATQEVYKGMGLNLGLHGATLALGVWLRAPGMLVAAFSISAAALVECVYLYQRTGARGLLHEAPLRSEHGV